MTTNPEIQKDDEISLFDLFIILLRYRKMICAIMLCAVITVIAGYFFYPSSKKSKNDKTYETRIAISLTPGTRYLLFNNNLSNQSFASYFIYPQVIHDALKETQQVSPQSNEVLQWLLEQVTSSSDQRKYESTNKKLLIREDLKSNVLEIICKGDEPQTSIIFLQNLFLYGSMALDNYIKPLLETYVDVYGSVSQPVSENDYYVMIKALADGRTNVAVQLFEPYVLEEVTAKSTRYSVFALVIIFAVLFLSIFLAFCLNAIKNIISDQETVRKIRVAMGKLD